jgi:hypothetical protein
MRYSELQVGDIIQDHTAHGRTYTSTVTRTGFTSTFGHKSFASGIYEAKAYETECEGKKYIHQLKSKHVPTLVVDINPDFHSVIRKGKFIVK